MNNAEPPKAMSKPVKTSSCKKNTITNTKRANMKADRKMDIAIANLSCDRLAKFYSLVSFHK